MYTKNECKEIMKEIEKIKDEQSRKILRSIVFEITSENIPKIDLEPEEAEAEEVDEKELIKYITNTIVNLGIPASLKGYYYIREAIFLTVLDVERLEKVTARLYPDIAKKYKTTSTGVERAIRNAIEVAWSRGNLDVFHDVFGYTVNDKKGRPTNSEFIALISDEIRFKFNM